METKGKDGDQERENANSVRNVVRDQEERAPLRGPGGNLKRAFKRRGSTSEGAARKLLSRVVSTVSQKFEWSEGCSLLCTN